MSRQNVLGELQTRASPQIKASGVVPQALALYEELKGIPEVSAIPEVLALAERLRINTLQGPEELLSLESSVSIKSGDLLASDYLIRQLLPLTEATRKELFGGSEPPFSDDILTATAWLETESPLERTTQETTGKSDDDPSDPFRETIKELSPLQRELVYPVDNTVRVIRTKPGTFLHNIARVVDSISRAGGFSRHATTAFLLCGIAPILPRVRFRVDVARAALPPLPENGEKGKEMMPRRLLRRSLEVNINAADLTPRELKQIYEGYRRALKVQKSKTLSVEQVRLYYLVHERGGPPLKGTKAFWEMIRDEWNGTGKNKPYRSWEGVYQRYRIVEKKLEKLFVR